MFYRLSSAVMAAGLLICSSPARADEAGSVYHADWFEPPTGESDWIQLTQDVRALETEDAALAAGAAVSASARGRAKDAFGTGAKASISLLSTSRRARASRTTAAVVLGIEATSRATTDAGDLLAKSSAGIGVATQKRTPVITDTRIRGTGTGKQVANGSYWLPARLDLDTLMSKIDSRSVEDMIVIKGPYSSLYGPGYNFTDIKLISPPRHPDGFEAHGSTSAEYKTNGEQFYARQTVAGGDRDWGFRFAYGHRTGNDYTTGDRRINIPSSYKSRDIDASLSWDPSSDERFELRYLRLDQTDVEYPGMVFDMDFLKTDAIEVIHTLENQPDFDRMISELWWNRTTFEGNTLGSGKRRQIPTLPSNLFPFDGSGDVSAIDASIIALNGVGIAFTDVTAMSTGFSSIVTWGSAGNPELSLGVDLRAVTQELNDVEPLRPANANNFPIPPSYVINPGILFEYILPTTDAWTLQAGGRLDLVMSDADNVVQGVGTTTVNPGPVFVGAPQTIADRLQTDRLDRHFELWSLFLTSEYELTDTWTASGGIGFAQRAPNLTELYAAGSFINLLQSGLTTLTGDPELDKESIRQIDVGLRYQNQDDTVRARGTAYYAWLKNYITFDGGLITEPQIGQKNNRMTFVNTPHATLSGFELQSEYDMTPEVTTFAQMSYTEGRDHSRRDPSRTRTVGNRSGVDTPKEPLPGIPPLETRVGIRLHSAANVDDDQSWAVEFRARIVDNQDRFASSLFERGTPGFTTFDLRGFWQASPNVRLTAGVENLSDKFYREHLDYRTGRGVFQPGINTYFGSELTY